ncbi:MULTISPECIES: hypothetical protein [Mycolicibacterium]|uniref:hypothetical protein n=1 Tax=Mycolicibacterium TaxID=1866885 RepID=UPI0007EDFECC|nr:hypothetical protein [Mycolicibacterium fortuitum]MCA4727047.1 hypothetical protein [Mycolicibacterium fortuitum]OBK07629.1 hypothetical protein A5637_04720 [Mycolicibacterium fortuitum]
MQPYEAITLVERVLRDLIREVMAEGWRDDPAVRIDRLEDKLAAERAKRRGTIASSDLIEYLEFHQLREIIGRDQNWARFEPILGKKKYFETYMDRLEGFRNPTMHGRQLYPFEQSLVVGIVGEITNQVTIWRSEQGPDLKYYPEIVSVTDSFGRQPRNGTPAELCVRPGDCITFKCIGSDPHGRLLRWELRVKSRGGSMITEDGARARKSLSVGRCTRIKSKKAPTYGSRSKATVSITGTVSSMTASILRITCCHL